jgi:DNA-binding MarR family transcriptional regulator
MNRRQMESFYPLTLAVRRLFHKLGHGVAALHQDSKVSVGMRAVLESIVYGGPQTVPHMARVRPVTRQHIQGLVNALLNGGYVEYIDNPAHKRSKLVSPTKRGLQAFQEMRERENEAFGRVSLDATSEDLEAANTVLRVLITTFESPEWLSLVNEYAPDTKE